MNRPSMGGTRVSVKADAVISAICTGSMVPPGTIRLRPMVRNALSSSRVRTSFRHATKSWSERRSSLFRSTFQFSSATTR